MKNARKTVPVLDSHLPKASVNDCPHGTWKEGGARQMRKGKKDEHLEGASGKKLLSATNPGKRKKKRATPSERREGGKTRMDSR